MFVVAIVGVLSIGDALVVDYDINMGMMKGWLNIIARLSITSSTTGHQGRFFFMVKETLFTIYQELKTGATTKSLDAKLARIELERQVAEKADKGQTEDQDEIEPLVPKTPDQEDQEGQRSSEEQERVSF